MNHENKDQGREEPPEAKEAPAGHPSPPYLTWGFIALCAFVSLAFITEIAGQSSARIIEQTLAKYWVFHPHGIWDGGYWSLLGAPFVHPHVFVLLINLYFLWLLGGRVEFVLGRQALFAVVFFSALVSSGAQLAFGGWPVFGCSGIVFALFGLIVALRPRNDLFSLIVPAPLIRYVLIWFVLCNILGLVSPIRVPFVGNVAALGFGFAAGYAFKPGRWHAPAVGAIVVLISMTVLSVTWAPWKAEWKTWRFFGEMEAERYDRAEQALASLIEKGDARALNNLAWVLATSREERLRDGERAIDLARRACVASGWLEPSFIDTLAAAHAETGHWEHAERQQLAALTLLRRRNELGDFPDYEQEEVLRGNYEKIRGGEKIRK